MRQKPSLLAFILAGIRHRPGRNLATVFCFAFIAATIFSAQFLVAGTAETFREGSSRMGADLLVIPSQYTTLVKGTQMGPVSAGTIIRVEPSSLRMNSSVMDKIGILPDVSSMSPQLYVASLSVPDLSPTPVDIYGIDPVTDFTVRPWLQEPLKGTLGHGEVLVGNAVGGNKSSLITLGKDTYTIAGRLDPTRSAVDQSVFMTFDDAYTLAAEPAILPPTAPPVLPGEVSAVLVQAGQGADPAMVGARVQQPFSYSYLKVMGRHFALKPASQAVGGLSGILNAIAVIVILASLPLVAIISAMVAHERKREIGMLVAMGAKRNLVFFLIMAESLVLAAAGGIAGIIAGGGIFFLLISDRMAWFPFMQGFRAPPIPEAEMMALVSLGIVILVGSVASIWPAYRGSRMNPYDAIRSGE